MKRNLSSVAVPFPGKLMSSARSPLVMGAEYGREIKNMLMGADGAGAKRNGVVAVGSGLDGEVITAVMGLMAGGSYQLLVATDAGNIYKRVGEGWVLSKSGLDGQGVVRSVIFGGRLLVCNGIDPVLAYDGTSWEVVSTLVKDASSGLAYVSATSFSIASDVAFYPVGSVVKGVLGTTSVQAHVVSATEAAGVLTVVLDAPVLTASLTEVWFTVVPPRVAYLAVAHDRLWGFGKGPLAPGMSGDVDRLRVFYTHCVNDFTAWPNPETGIVPSLNLADKAGVADEVLAMAVRDGITVFVGRNHLQLWTGTDPDADGDLAWSKTIPLGAVHGNAVLELPNDLLFVTRQGARTLSRTVQTEQLDVKDVGNELDPTFAALLERVMADGALYRQVVALRNEAQGWLGIHLLDRTLVWQMGAFGYGWVVFDGVFGGITASHTTPDGVLYVAKAGQLYRYDAAVWSDAGEAISTKWWLPWVSPAKGKRWANSYVEVLAAPGSAVDFTLKRYRDYDQGNPAIYGMSAPVEPDFWDTSDWDDALWDSGETVLPVVRDHVVLTTCGYVVESASTTGPFSVVGIKLYGVAEQ